MSIRIVLHNQKPVYTNLDIISGIVFLNITREEPFTAITVKLECESRTRLSTTRPDGRRQDVEFELHKLLYRTDTVFPNERLLQSAAGVRSPSFSLVPGTHQFPFQFKFPFNNACIQSNSMMMMGQDTNRHVKKTLPPSLTGFPGEAAIRYFIKVTAQRTGIFKENYREEINLHFRPTEPPRPPTNKRESYARRQHQFSLITDTAASNGFFRNPPRPSGPPPRVSIDGRLPDPPIITVGQAIPLRVLVKKLNSTPEILFLKSFHIVLVGFTKIRAHELERVEQNTWVVASHANLQVAIGDSSIPVDKDVEINKSMWSNVLLPGSIAPTFETCNLSRWYELRVEVGLGWGTPGDVKPELSVQSLRMPVDVFSGIKAPEHVLSQMGQRPSINTQQSATSQQSFHAGPSTPQSAYQTPITSPQNAFPFQPIVHPQIPHDPEAGIDDPPPSYEAAIAEGISPANGPEINSASASTAAAAAATPVTPNEQARTKGERLFGER